MAKSIAIIGAGCAGLGAATIFMAAADADIDVTLIDAGAVMGGRARTSTDPQGLPVDLGPQFIQDPGVNPWMNAAQLLGYQPDQLLQPDIQTRFRIVQDGTWSNSYGTSGIDVMNARLEDQYRVATGFKNAPIMTGNAPAFCKGQQDLRLSLGSSPFGAISESTEPWQYLASDKARQVEVNAGVNVYVEGGLGTLVKTYGETLIQQHALKLKFVGNMPVLTIDDSANDVTVTTADGQSAAYDFCLVTIPSSEVGKIGFVPPLPGPMVRADGFIALGSYKKVAFRPTAFPPGSDDADAIDHDAIAKNCEYYIYDNGQDGAWQYFRLPTDPTILICVAAGDFARRLDGIADNDAAAAIIDLLTEAYPAGSNFAPAANQKVVTNWTNAPYVRGAYSYTRHDDRLAADDPIPFEARERIREPHGRVHFAGEATWTQAYGTIHGAYNSGERAAQAILAIIGAG